MIKIEKYRHGYRFVVAGTVYHSNKSLLDEALLECAALADKCGCFTDYRLLLEYAATIK